MALPAEWIERIFTRMAGMYGARFLDLWKDVDLDVVKRTWAEGLAGFSGEEVARGLEACKQRAKFPPTLPEFVVMCRSQGDMAAAESLFVFAQHAIQAGDWQGNRLAYWTAQFVGVADVRNNPWLYIKSRWTKALNDCIAESELPEIPAPRSALPAPGNTHKDNSDVARHNLCLMKQRLGMVDGELGVKG